jgi:hypothetical protein
MMTINSGSPPGPAMTEWTFRLTVCGIELTDEQLDTLHEAGCDDGSFSVEPDGTVLGFFDREASTEQDAVISAIVDIEHAGIGFALRNTATSWRRTSSSASLDADERPSNTNQPSNRTKIR